MIAIDLSGSTALVTGAGGGIGEAVAERFLDAGATVVAHGRTLTPSLAALGERSGTHLAVGDLEDAAFVQNLFAQSAPYGPIDVLVNNAGSYPSRPLLETGDEEVERVVRGNLGITFSCLREAGRSMRGRGRGVVVNIGSLNASRPGHEQAVYDSAKAGILALTRAAAVELAPYGVRVNAVSPGLVDRPGLGSAWPEGVAGWLARSPSRRLGRPRDVADACLFLASPLATWITGQELVVDGGISAASDY
ncbi:SDR family NAD(P)-dependent oxidoreductase [Nocardioides silvaticus]|uniref:SDR family NAD(P)-dependent oxidoreductase n=1 Tax=Nocardioides silvaticus TaxID=2201891 RepID=UPI001B8725F2|nr:SDR family oxidoreductase [Nocardioides silvaticus]